MTCFKPSRSACCVVAATIRDHTRTTVSDVMAWVKPAQFNIYLTSSGDIQFIVRHVMLVLHTTIRGLDVIRVTNIHTHTQNTHTHKHTHTHTIRSRLRDQLTSRTSIPVRDVMRHIPYATSNVIWVTQNNDMYIKFNCTFKILSKSAFPSLITILL